MSRLQLHIIQFSSWSLDRPGNGVRMDPSEANVKGSSRLDIRILARHHLSQSLFLESKSERTWTFLIDLEMVSDWREYPSEDSVKVSSRSDIKNHVKTPPVLAVLSFLMNLSVTY